ncbi:uncharacterized protein LOC128883090 isoform X2 [Hylaeus volcanicus]|uniref:uncharacterized protein LOC128883090 isoform X2 n=1 Tax=Hylaeus volcanicus TaxID=313075 RepID=UPI0023B7ACE4|nr:uncharacterized protein LOC128883090 isoform X2 [Hylaeus volcanicus]
MLNKYNDVVSDTSDLSITRGKGTIDYQQLIKSHETNSSQLLNHNVKVIESVIDDLQEIVKSISGHFSSKENPSTTALPASSIATITQLNNTIPMKLSKLRRHYRDINIFAHDSTTLTDTLKSLNVKTTEELIDYELQLSGLEKIIIQEQSEIPTPKFKAIVPFFQRKKKKPISNDTDTCSNAITNTEKEMKGCQDEVVMKENKLVLKEEQHMLIESLDSTLIQKDVEMSCEDNDEVIDMDDPALNSQPLEKYYLDWLKAYLVRRTQECAEIESVKRSRHVAEEKVKVFQKSEAELASRLSPLEKELAKFTGTINRTRAPAAALSGVKQTPLSVFPSKAYSLSTPLLTLFTKFFCYKSVNSDGGIELRLNFQATSKSNDPLFECDTGRLQVLVDKATTWLPPISFSKTASLFPLNIRFSYFPKLNLVSAVCQFPRAIGSDSSFLSDLFFSDDNGCLSPNPLHHIAKDFSHLMASMDEQNEKSTSVKDFQTLPYAICSRISERQAGRPYRWAQQLADNAFSVDATSVPNFTMFTEKLPIVTAGNFVKLFRLRAAHRSWSIYIEESLRENPQRFPPRGVNLPAGLDVRDVFATSVFTAFSSSSFNEFVSKGGSSKFQDIEASYLSAELNVQAVVFIVLIAVPAYGRASDLCFYIKEVKNDIADDQGVFMSPNIFSLGRKFLFSDGKHRKDTTILSHEEIANSASVCLCDQDKELFEKWIQLHKEVVEKLMTMDDTKYKKSVPRSVMDVLNQIYPTSSCTTNCNVSPERPFLHFYEKSLSDIQTNVNTTIPEKFAADKNNDHFSIILVIQLYYLVFYINNWVKDVKHHKFIPLAPIHANQTTSVDS